MSEAMSQTVPQTMREAMQDDRTGDDDVSSDDDRRHDEHDIDADKHTRIDIGSDDMNHDDTDADDIDTDDMSGADDTNDGVAGVDNEDVGGIPLDERHSKDRCKGLAGSDHSPATIFPAETAHNAPTPPPSDLLDTGSALWRDVVKTYELRSDEVPLLAEMCRAVDRLAGIRAALVGQSLLVAGSTGQQRAHPLLGEERATVLVLAKLQAQLGLPDEVGQAGATPASRKAAKAANERWRREAVILDGAHA